MRSLEITVCGCGNGAHACAALLSKKGHKVSIYSPLAEEVEKFRENNSDLKMSLEVGGEQFDDLPLNVVTTDPEEAIPSSSVVFVIVPAFAHSNVVNNIRKHLPKKSLLAIVPSRGGFEYEAKAKLAGHTIMGLQTLPWACRIKEFGKSVQILGTKKSVQTGCMPEDISDIYLKQMEDLLDIDLDKVSSMTTLTLGNVGQIIHPGIMYGLFKDNPNVTYLKDETPLFYQGVDETVATILKNLSDEIISVAHVLSEKYGIVNADEVLPLEKWLMNSYNHSIKDRTSMKTMFNTNESYQGLKVPSKKVDDTYYAPNFHDRYITEDVPYGLLIVKSLAQMIPLETPQMDEVIKGLGRWNDENYFETLIAIKKFSKKSRIPEFYSYNDISSLM